MLSFLIHSVWVSRSGQTPSRGCSPDCLYQVPDSWSPESQSRHCNDVSRNVRTNIIMSVTFLVKRPRSLIPLRWANLHIIERHFEEFWMIKGASETERDCHNWDSEHEAGYYPGPSQCNQSSRLQQPQVERGKDVWSFVWNGKCADTDTTQH